VPSAFIRRDIASVLLKYSRTGNIESYEIKYIFQKEWRQVGNEIHLNMMKISIGKIMG
jgi:hypothetical protein